MINRIGHGRISCKDGGTNLLATSVVEIKYTVVLGLGTLLMYSRGEFRKF